MDGVFLCDLTHQSGQCYLVIFCYRMERNKMGLAVIINNLDQEQTPTKKDVEAMGQVLKTIGGL